MGNFSVRRSGEFVKVEIRDETYRIVHKTKFSCGDKEAILNLIKTLEKYGDFSIVGYIKNKIKLGKGDWW